MMFTCSNFVPFFFNLECFASKENLCISGRGDMGGITTKVVFSLYRNGDIIFLFPYDITKIWFG